MFKKSKAIGPILAIISLLSITSVAAAKPANFLVNMNNQLNQRVLLTFKFKNESTDHSVLFAPGKSGAPVLIEDDSVISSDVAASYSYNIQKYPCTLTAVGSFTPTTMWVTVNSDHTCQLSLSG